MKKNIVRRPLAESAASDFDALHPVLKRVYTSRRIRSAEEIETSLEKLLPYQDMLGLEKALPLLADAVRNNRKILIVGDFDADGATSTAVAVRAMKSFGAEQVSFLVPNRFAFGYGLTPELVAGAGTQEISRFFFFLPQSIKQ